MQATFSPEQISAYKAFVNAVKVTQHEGGDKTGRLLVQLSQGGALINLAGNATGMADTGHEFESGAILITPYVLSKMLTNPTTARWLIRGFSLPAKSEQGGLLAGRLLYAAFPRTTTQGKLQAAPGPMDAASGAQPIHPMAVQE
jgi:hypothetical protein